MFLELVKNLTTDQIDELERLGVARARVSEWRKGKGVPSRKAVLLLAQVTGENAINIEAEIMLMEAAPEQRDLFRRILNEAGAAVAIWLLAFGVTYAPKDANATPLPKGLTESHSVYYVN